MKVLDLFSGIGGFSLAAHQLGWETIGFVEKEPFCQKVLRKNFDPNISLIEDIFDVTRKSFQRPGIITAGFPCQPYSSAGMRRGVRDERFLVPQLLVVIEMFRPAWVVLENVTGILTIPQQSRAIKMERDGPVRTADGDSYTAVQTRQDEMLIGSICDDLEALNYEVQPITVPAVASGADHKRDRIWIIANSHRKRRRGRNVARRRIRRRTRKLESGKSEWDAVWSEVKRCFLYLNGGDRNASGNVRVGAGLSAKLDKFSRDNRTARLKALGNSVHVPTAYAILKAIDETQQSYGQKPKRNL